jgi:hypothetical protein
MPPPPLLTSPRPLRIRRLRRLGVLWLASLLLLGACAQRAPRPSAAPSAAAPLPALSDARARQLIGEWQRQLADHLAVAGGGDPAALARLPAQRATGTLRPGRITFGVLDLDASAGERDGFDVQGVLLAPLQDVDPQPYVFAVGIVQRAGYRPVDIEDIRLVALTMRAGRPDWTVGGGDPQALQRYRAHIDRSTSLRFPADQDDFALTACAVGLCGEERASGARWSVPVGVVGAQTASRTE